LGGCLAVVSAVFADHESHNNTKKGITKKKFIVILTENEENQWN
jgi:hypothetical protein